MGEVVSDYTLKTKCSMLLFSLVVVLIVRAGPPVVQRHLCLANVFSKAHKSSIKHCSPTQKRSGFENNMLRRPAGNLGEAM